MKPEEIRQAKKAVAFARSGEYRTDCTCEDCKAMFSNLSLALKALSIVENLPEVADIYGWLIDIVNIAEHLRGEERIEYLRKQAVKLSTRRISKG